MSLLSLFGHSLLYNQVFESYFLVSFIASTHILINCLY